jgi:cardiolipin-specific phospholipase
MGTAVKKAKRNGVVGLPWDTRTRSANGYGLRRSSERENADTTKWTNMPAATAEHNVLSFVPYLQSPPTQARTGAKAAKNSPQDGSSEPPSTDDLTKSPSQSAESKDDPYGPRRWHSNLVKLSGKNRALNEFSVERLGEDVHNNLVIVHGYGAGLGFFYKNFEALSRVAGWRLYALDMLGMGRSTRPPFKINAKDRQASITEAEDWFVDSLEEWRKERKLDKFTLLGHSLGGYMAVAYALKYPGHLNKLILASPVGIPEDPYAVNADMPEPNSSSLEAEVKQDQGESTSANPGDNNNFFNAKDKKEAREASGKPPPRKPLPKWLTYLWDANVSPFSLVRWSGPFGPRFVSGWTSRRFSHLPPEEAQALHSYAYTLFKQRGSGEYALAYILAPGAFARSPLIRRVAGIGRQYITPNATSSSNVADAQRKRETGYPVVLMYGENDWMDVKGGHAAAQKIREEKEKVLQQATPEQRQQENGDAKVVIIKKAGHHVYLDGWEEFNSIMADEMKDVERREHKLKAHASSS